MSTPATLPVYFRLTVHENSRTRRLYVILSKKSDEMLIPEYVRVGIHGSVHKCPRGFTRGTGTLWFCSTLCCLSSLSYSWWSASGFVRSARQLISQSIVIQSFSVQTRSIGLFAGRNLVLVPAGGLCCQQQAHPFSLPKFSAHLTSLRASQLPTSLTHCARA